MVLSFGLAFALLESSVTIVSQIDDRSPNAFYANQKAPLTPSELQKLPTGSVRGGGWLQKQLELQRDGFSGNLSTISKFLNISDSAWMRNETSARAGWEELPYWLRGQVSLAYVLNDKKLISECQKWIEGVLAGQRADGYFGPDSNLKTSHGTPDLWPNMLMQCVIQTYYEATNDQRALKFLSKYVDWLATLPDEALLDPKPYWQYYRAADLMASLIWLENRVDNPNIMSVALRLHKGSANWVKGVPNYHGVNFGQGFREPALYSLFSKSKSDRAASENDLKIFRNKFGQMPGGMYGADENAREGYDDPRQAAETCAVAEMIYSDGLLMETLSETKWADDIEDITYNWLPATMTEDLKAVRYLTCGNMAISDRPSKSPGIENGGPMFLYDPRDHRCCQHNVGMAWPYFTERTWLATNGNGLFAAVLAPSNVTAKVGNGEKVRIEETTDYPFDETVQFKFGMAKAVQFPFYVRIPKWCQNPSVSINGRSYPLKGQKGSLVKLARTWKSGDKVTLKLPMNVEVRTWPKRPGTTSIYRGPLAYSLAIKEDKVLSRSSDKWPSYELFPKSNWNYGLLPKVEAKVIKSKLSAGLQPFTSTNVPIRLQVEGRKIKEWTTDMYGLVSPLQASPAKSTEPIEKLTLIPMGAARLRITVFPTVSATAGTTWKAPLQAKKSLPTTYSFRGWWDSEAALSDGIIPDKGNTQTIPRFTWWDHKGSVEWVQYTFPATRTFQRTTVFWFDDRQTGGGCRVPKSWWMEVKIGGEWKRVEDLKTISKDEIKEAVTFRPVGATEVRLVAQLEDGFSAGILEWEIE